MKKEEVRGLLEKDFERKNREAVNRFRKRIRKDTFGYWYRQLGVVVCIILCLYFLCSSGQSFINNYFVESIICFFFIVVGIFLFIDSRRFM